MSKTKKIILDGGPRDGLVVEISSHLDEIEVAYVPDGRAIRCDSEDAKPQTIISVQKYKNTYQRDEGRMVFRPLVD